MRSKETKRKMSEAKKGNKNPMFGRHHTEKTKRKMSETRKGQAGEKNFNWKGGRKKSNGGYVLVFSPQHPCAEVGGYMLEHRLLMEVHLGRYLGPSEVVHHQNGVVDDNRIENLRLFPSTNQHTKHHRSKDDLRDNRGRFVEASG